MFTISANRAIKNIGQDHVAVHEMDDMSDDIKILLESNNLSPSTQQALSRIITAIGSRFNRLEAHIIEQDREIELTRTACAVSFVLEDAQTQRLILQVNAFQQSIQSHVNSHALTQLSMSLVGALRAHCNALIPLASGFYRPHASSASAVELGHAGGHVMSHGIHYIERLHHSVAVSMSIPIIGLAATVYDVWHEHHLLHEAEEAVRKLGIYSDNQRDAIYRYVVSRTILAFASSFEGKALQQCHANILFEIFSCLPKLHACEAIDDLANNWSQATNHAIQQSGVIMFPSAQSVKSITYTKDQLSIAWKVQQIFLDTDETAIQKHLTLPKINDFLHDSHRRIYQEVLEPYDARANSNIFASFFHGFNSEQLWLIKKYQSCFIRALGVIKKELTPLEEADNSSYILQLNLINTCLYANLNAMGLAMKWHNAQGLFSEIAAGSPRLSCTPCPLDEVSKGTLKIVSVEGQLAEANVRADKAEDRAEEARIDAREARADVREARADARKARADAKKSAVASEESAADAKQAMDAVLSMQEQPPITASVTSRGIFAHTSQSPAVDYRLAQLPEGEQQFTLEAKVLYVTNMAAIQAGTDKQLQYAVMNSSNQRVDGALTLGEINKKGSHTFEKPITFDQLEPCLRTMLKLIDAKEEPSSVQARAPVSI